LAEAELRANNNRRVHVKYTHRNYADSGGGLLAEIIILYPKYRNRTIMWIQISMIWKTMS